MLNLRSDEIPSAANSLELRKKMRTPQKDARRRTDVEKVTIISEVKRFIFVLYSANTYIINILLNILLINY